MILISFQLALARELCDTLKKFISSSLSAVSEQHILEKVTSDDNE